MYGAQLLFPFQDGRHTNEENRSTRREQLRVVDYILFVSGHEAVLSFISFVCTLTKASVIQVSIVLRGYAHGALVPSKTATFRSMEEGRSSKVARSASVKHVRFRRLALSLHAGLRN